MNSMKYNLILLLIINQSIHKIIFYSSKLVKILSLNKNTYDECINFII